MHHTVSRMSFVLASILATVMPAAADELKDAIECEQSVAMSVRQIPAGHEAEADAKALLNAWTTHVRLLSGDAETLTDDRAAANQVIYNVAYTGDAAARQAFFAALERCKTPPETEATAYPALTCASFARYAEKAAEDTIVQQEGRAQGFAAEGQTEKAAIAQAYVDDAQRRLKLAAKIRHAYYTAQPTTRVEPKHFGLFGAEGEPLLQSCVASMGLEG